MDATAIIVLPLIIGYLLDLLFGDPRWLPHPVVLFGNMIIKGEKFLNRGKAIVIKGALMVALFCIIVFYVFYFIMEYTLITNDSLYLAVASLLVFFGLANKSLIGEGREVFHQLYDNGLEAGRKRVSWIVGRDTSELSAQEVKTATLETLSENLSDGVVAPLFYFAIGGVPAMMTYKMINTLDSMVGYKNERYRKFGMVAARLDDVANFIPARLTALLMIMVSFNLRALKFIFKYGRAHTSPNAGYPEAALAGILNCRFGGPHDYFGKSVYKPFIGDNPKDITQKDFKRTAIINHTVCFVSVLIIVFVRWSLLQKGIF